MNEEMIVSIVRNMEILHAGLQKGFFEHKSEIMDLLFEATETIKALTENKISRTQAVLHVDDLNRRLKEGIFIDNLVPYKKALENIQNNIILKNPQLRSVENEPIIRERLLHSYLESTESNISSIQSLLFDMELQKSDTRTFDKAFKLAHTIKGDAGMMGMSKVVVIAQEIESVIGALREKRLKSQTEITAVLLEATAAIRPLIRAEVGDSLANKDVEALKGRLVAVLKPGFNQETV